MTELRRMEGLHAQAAWSVILAITTLRWPREPSTRRLNEAFTRATGV